jgi:Flp pilus assembly protein TadG
MRNGERGASMVEMVIVVMLFLTVIFGITEFGRALFTYHAISNAARIATRYAIVHGGNCKTAGCPATSDSIQTYVQNSTPGVDKNSLTATASWSGTALDGSTSCATSEKPGCTVSVTVTYPFSYILPFLALGSISMSSTSQMVVSN